MEANDELKKPFKKNSPNAKEFVYIDILSNNEKINTITELLGVLKEKFPNDSSVNRSRVGREIRGFVKEKKLRTNCRSIIAVKEWMKEHHVNTKMHCMLRDVQDFSKCDLGLFLKVESYRAAPLGEIIRKAFEGSHCFVISDYDTVLVRFGEKEDYDIFLDLCKQFIPNFPKD